jgi:putative peptidoglycan lipid II flippase
MSRLTRISLLLACLFSMDKGVAILRQVIIARQFGLSAELDAYNVANNLPDLLFALISGGALAVAFIPVLSEVLTTRGREDTWKLFSRIANLAFLVTGVLAIITALLAKPMVEAEFGIAPGFSPDQQQLVTRLMRLNLVATLIFSISGLVMAGLQANQHFLLPAMAPLLYNVGQVFGAVVLAPEKGYSLGGLTLPAFGMGVNGLVAGVIVGACLHLGIQLPGLIRYKFRWHMSLGLRDTYVIKVLRLLGPRLVTMFIIQLIFIVRDNLASRLAEGAVSALSYGWMIQQVPETLIGTAIGTALLPTLAEMAALKDETAFRATLDRAAKVIMAFTLPVAVLVGLALGPLVQFAFGFDEAGTQLLLNVTRGYLAGLFGHCLLEISARSFYARQNAWIPLAGAFVNVSIYISLGSLLYRRMGAAGVSLTDACAFTTQALFLFLLLNWREGLRTLFGSTLLRAVLGALAGGGVAILVMRLGEPLLPGAVTGLAAGALGLVASLPFIWSEVRLVLKL